MSCFYYIQSATFKIYVEWGTCIVFIIYTSDLFLALFSKNKVGGVQA